MDKTESTYKHTVHDVRALLGVSMSMVNKYLREININRPQFPTFETSKRAGKTLYYSDNEVAILKDVIDNRREFVLDCDKPKEKKMQIDKSEYVKYSELVSTVENTDKLPKSQIYNHLMTYENMFTKIVTGIYVHKSKVDRVKSLIEYYVCENYDDESVRLFTLYDIKRKGKDEFIVYSKKEHDSDEVLSVLNREQLINIISKL